ncbi:hypothetical protein SRABI83_01315 [Arthrobacter sp. Bi83]|nr:hypothetical protein SRABI83_01315 [Arthrobacter sp. Bi83]
MAPSAQPFGQLTVPTPMTVTMIRAFLRPQLEGSELVGQGPVHSGDIQGGRVERFI